MILANIFFSVLVEEVEKRLEEEAQQNDRGRRRAERATGRAGELYS